MLRSFATAMVTASVTATELPATTVEGPVKNIFQFGEGFILEFVKDELKDLKDCWTGGVLIEHQIAAAIKLFEKGGKINMTKAIFSLKDVAAISGWGAAVSGHFLPAKIGTNLITHHS